MSWRNALRTVVAALIVHTSAMLGSAHAADASAFARLVAARYNLDARHIVTTDIDFDGDLDVVVSTDRGFLIWVNDGEGRFTSETPKHRPIVDGHTPPDTWDDAQPSHQETIQSGVSSAPLTAERTHSPPPLSTTSDILNDPLLHAGRARGGSTPRAPPLDV